MAINCISLIWLKDVAGIWFILLSLYHTLYLLLFTLIFKKKITLFNKAILWVLLEWVRCELIAGGSPFLPIGVTLSDFPELMQLASIGGIYLLSFFIILISLLSASLFNNHQKKIKTLIFIFLLTTTPCIYGFIKLNINQSVNTDTNPFNICIIQPDIHPELKWDFAKENKRLEIIKQLVLNSYKNTDLLVLPETVFTYDYRINPKIKKFLKNLLINKNSLILFGAIDELSVKNTSFNGAFLLDKDLEVKSIYHKINLVPFGEYIPLRKLMPELACLTPIGNGFKAGSKLPLMILKNNITITPVICFEDCLSSFVRVVCKQHSDLIITITNDGWFKNIEGPLMHERLARFRAVENRVPLIRCANTGISSFIDSYGRVLQKIEDKNHRFVNISGVMNCQIYKRDYSRTIFSFIGYWWILALIVISFCYSKIYKKR